jgi:hypothetical protein
LRIQPKVPAPPLEPHPLALRVGGIPDGAVQNGENTRGRNKPKTFGPAPNLVKLPLDLLDGVGDLPPESTEIGGKASSDNPGGVAVRGGPADPQLIGKRLGGTGQPIKRLPTGTQRGETGMRLTDGIEKLIDIGGGTT